MQRSLYTRPDKPLFVPVRERGGIPPVATKELAQPMAVDQATECHVTPPDIAQEMADAADLGPAVTVLEPSAGTGALIRAALNAGAALDNLTAVERHLKLCDTLAPMGLGARLHGACFLDFARDTAERFDCVLMNPPFRQVRQHMRAALSLTKLGGEVIALVPITFNHPGAETLRQLPADTFATAKVHTKIIRFTP